jgi:hypothetical protein
MLESGLGDDHLTQRMVKFDTDFFSDTNLLILAVELRVYNPFEIIQKPRTDPYFLIS